MNSKKVYLYNLKHELIRVFDTTDDCADYFNYDRMYIYHNLKYCRKIYHKQEHKWYIIKRDLIIPIGKQQSI